MKLTVKEEHLKIAVAGGLVVLTALLFVGGPNHYVDRLVAQVWESGHFSLFALASFAMFRLTFMSAFPFKYQFGIATIFCLVFGLGTEIAQVLVDRSFELKDILNDFIGTYTGLAAALIDKSETKSKNVLLLVGVLIGLLLGVRGFTSAVYDEYVRTKQFPLLSGFESELEIDRWDTYRTELSLSRKFVTEGDYSLQATMLPARYPDITLQYFEGDWSEYEFLEFDLSIEEGKSLDMELKIYDYQHPLSGYQYNDRYNLKFTLAGNTIHFKIPLNEIKHSPEWRYVDLTNVLSFSIFTYKLREPTSIYLDNLRLTNRTGVASGI